MKNSRARVLMTRELDGELSCVERAELDRALQLSGLERKERSAWARVVRSSTADRAVPRLDDRKMAGRIVSGLGASPKRRGPRYVAIAAAAALLLVAVAEPPAPRRSVGAAQSLAALEVESSRAPVVVQVDGADFGSEAEPVPVEIRF